MTWHFEQIVCLLSLASVATTTRVNFATKSATSCGASTSWWYGSGFVGVLVDPLTLTSIGDAFVGYSCDDGKILENKVLPDQVYATNAVSSCFFSADAATYESYEEFNSAQNNKVAISGSVKKFVGSFSQENKQVRSQTSMHGRTVSQVRAECEKWGVSLKTTYPNFTLSGGLQLAVSALPFGVWNDAMYPAYETFFRMNGGLVRTQATVGANLYITSFTDISYVNSVGVAEVTRQARASFYWEATGDKTERDQITSQYASATTGMSLQWHGGGNWTGNWTDWSNSVGTTSDAVPIGASYQLLSDFLTSSMAPNVPASRLVSIQKNMFTAFQMFVGPRCAWNETWLASAQPVYAKVVVHPRSAEYGWTPGPPQPPSLSAEFASAVLAPLAPGQSTTITSLRVGSLSAGTGCVRMGCAKGLFAYVVPNLLQLVCTRTQSGAIVASVGPGDGGGPWQAWPSNCGDRKNKPCVGGRGQCGMGIGLFPNLGCLPQAGGQLSTKGLANNCSSTVDFRIPGSQPLVLRGYYDDNKHFWYISYDLHVEFTCSLDPSGSPWEDTI